MSADEDATMETIRLAVSRHFDEVAEGVPSRPDMGDLFRRRGRRRRRRVTASMVLAVVALGGGAFAVRPNHLEQVVAGPDARRSAGAAAPERPEFARGRADVMAAVERTTEDGLRLRGVLLPVPAPDPGSFEDVVPAECRPSATAEVSVEYPDGAVVTGHWQVDRLRPGEISLSLYPIDQLGTMGAAVYSRPEASAATPGPGATGTSDTGRASLQLALVVRGGSGLESIRVSYGGIEDASGASEGFGVALLTLDRAAILTDPSTGLSLRSAAVTLTFADRVDPIVAQLDPFSSVIVGAGGENVDPIRAEATRDGRCLMSGPKLPTPGEQPGDPAASEAEVVAAVETAADGSRPIEERAAAFDDPVSARSLVAALLASELGVPEQMRAHVDDVVFTSPTEAIVRFDVTLPDADGSTPLAVYLTDRFGKVVLRDGRWRLTVQTACSVSSGVGGEACAGKAITFYPPEAYRQP